MDCSLNSPGRCLKIIDTLRETKRSSLSVPWAQTKKALKNFFKAFVLIPAMTYSPTKFP